MAGLLRRIGSGLRDGWLIFGIAIAFLCLLEAGLSAIYFVTDAFSWEWDKRIRADAYDGASWTTDYYVELDSIGNKWEPYVYWRRPPFRGRMINVDDDGRRVTTPTTLEPSALKIFMFGGSTLWGTGVRDAFTIPSLVARDLQRSGVLAAVTNFGESGYVSTQERIALELELIRGRRPDLVIFYDGINDTYSAFQQRVVGFPMNEYNRAREFNLLASERHRELVQHALGDVARGLSTARLLDQVRRILGGAPRPHSQVVPLGSSEDDEALARETLRFYAGNLEIVKALGRHYDFDFLPYWQPTILDKPHLTRYESDCRTEIAATEPLYRRTYDLVRQGHLDEALGVRDISQVFSETRTPVFVDFFHLSETGNEMVAKVIVADVLERIAGRRALRTTPSSAALP